ncbi:MAG: universal stress protein [Chloroflexota bacterium]|nr:universal stress protein [Chloroflexota bacterium]
MFQKVLVPLDGSSLAEAVLPYAEELALAQKSLVVLLQVIPPPSQVVGFTGTADLGPMTRTDVEAINATMEAETRNAAAYLQKQAGAMSERGVKAEWEVRQGPPGPTIVQCAKERGVDAIALSTHGRSGLGRLVFGSVAGHILRHWGLPILLIKPDMKGEGD